VTNGRLVTPADESHSHAHVTSALWQVPWTYQTLLLPNTEQLYGAMGRLDPSLAALEHRQPSYQLPMSSLLVDPYLVAGHCLVEQWVKHR
jgi:hypothetical protein